MHPINRSHHNVSRKALAWDNSGYSGTRAIHASSMSMPVGVKRKSVEEVVF